MALDLFRVQQGLEIENDLTGSAASILVGDGLPGGDGDIQDAAPIGSFFLRTNTETDGLQVYWKHTTANNSSADWKQSADKDYVDAIASGLSWREPVVARDGTLYADVSAFPVAGVIDGVTLAVNDRVLFGNVTTATDANVFIWDGITWTEDANAETDGDAVLVQGGTNAEEQWVYDGTNWVQFGSAAGSAELGFLRSFVGKTGPGAETPTYSSIDVVTQGGTLETAIGELDNSIGNKTYSNDNVVTDGQDVTTSIDALDTAIGSQLYTGDNVVTDGETVTASIDALDTAIGAFTQASLVTTGTNVSGPAVVDTIALLDATEAKWIIQVRENGTPANRRALEVHALTDGTNVDHTRYAVLKLGANIAGFSVTVDINGPDMRLLINATNAFDYVVKRVAVSAF